MIQEFVERFEKNKDKVREMLASHKRHYDWGESWEIEYKDIVKAVITVLHDGYGCPDPENIHEIDDGDYQGTLVYVIPEECYQPSDYWYVRVAYGSCCVNDTLQSITDCSGSAALDDLMTLALHIVQGLKKMDGEWV